MELGIEVPFQLSSNEPNSVLFPTTSPTMSSREFDPPPPEPDKKPLRRSPTRVRRGMSKVMLLVERTSSTNLICSPLTTEALPVALR